jgi:hypothetical protein
VKVLVALKDVRLLRSSIVQFLLVLLSKGRNMMEGWDVKSWVEGLGLPQYGETLVDNGFTDKEVVATLSDNDLEKIGVSVLGHRRKIMLAVAQLNENAEEKQSLKEWIQKAKVARVKRALIRPLHMNRPISEGICVWEVQFQ